MVSQLVPNSGVAHNKSKRKKKTTANSWVRLKSYHCQHVTFHDGDLIEGSIWEATEEFAG